MWGILASFLLGRLKKFALPLIVLGLLVMATTFLVSRHSVWVEATLEEAREEVRATQRKFDETRATEIRSRVRAVPRVDRAKRLHVVDPNDTRGYRD